jgi:hypothetical protein
MRKLCTLITSKGTDIDENIANQNHATRTRTLKPGCLNLSIVPIIGLSQIRQIRPEFLSKCGKSGSGRI